MLASRRFRRGGKVLASWSFRRGGGVLASWSFRRGGGVLASRRFRRGGGVLACWRFRRGGGVRRFGSGCRRVVRRSSESFRRGLQQMAADYGFFGWMIGRISCEYDGCCDACPQQQREDKEIPQHSEECYDFFLTELGSRERLNCITEQHHKSRTRESPPPPLPRLSATSSLSPCSGFIGKSRAGEKMSFFYAINNITNVQFR